MEKLLPSVYANFTHFSNIPLTNLQKIRRIEILNFILGLTNLILILTVSIMITQRGLEQLNAIVRITRDIWLPTIRMGYFLVWLIIAFVGVGLISRRWVKKNMIIPITLQDRLKQEQIFGDQPTISKKKTQDNDQNSDVHNNHRDNSEFHKNKENTNYLSKIEMGDIGKYLRNYRSYLIVSVIVILTLIGYINYFPRGESLFPSLWMDQEADPNLSFVLQPSEFFSFYIINLILGIINFALLFFLFGFQLRQIKDLTKLIDERIDRSIEERKKGIKQENKHPYKPPLEKPWEKMNMKERREYRLTTLKNKKEYIKESRKSEIDKIIKEEKERMKYGPDKYKRMQKIEKKVQKEIEKEKKKMIKRGEIIDDSPSKKEKEEKYDFR